MKAFSIMSLAVAALLLSACGSAQDKMEQKIEALQQENANLKSRVTTLEGQMESVIAALPDDDAANDDTDGTH